MELKELKLLIRKYQHGTCTEEEKSRLFQWYAIYDDEAVRLSATPVRKLELIWKSISREIHHKSNRHYLYYSSRIAAVALLLIGINVTLHFFFSDTVLQENVVAEQPIILPAEGTATLELSTGEQISLQSNKQTEKHLSALAVNHQDKNLLDYTQIKPTKAVSAVPVYNTIRVPAGCNYQVVLADGSKVHLNSCSSLKYPVHFTGDARQVVLNGEAFFDVSKGKTPFIVKTSNVDIHVYGTSFNVSNYETDACMVAALVSGKIKVCDAIHYVEYSLSPGKALTYEKVNSNVYTEEVNVSEYTSWMNGVFKFDNMRLEDIMTKLGRWYGCEINFTDEASKNRRMSGVARKERPMNEFLEIMQKVTGLQFDIIGSMITILKKHAI